MAEARVMPGEREKRDRFEVDFGSEHADGLGDGRIKEIGPGFLAKQ